MAKAKDTAKQAAKKSAKPKKNAAKKTAPKRAAKAKARPKGAARAKKSATPPAPKPQAPTGIPPEFNPQIVLMRAPAQFGRPTDYSPEVCERVYGWYSIGYTVPMICRELGICKQTYYNWTRDHPDFLDCHRRGKIACQGYYEQALRLAAIGAVKRFRHHAAKAILVHHHGYKDPLEDDNDGEDNQPMLVQFGEFIEPETIKEIEADNVQTA